MIKQKKGLSTVVTTLIIILLVLVAVGIIWIVVRGVIEGGTKEIDYGVKCLKTDVRATAATCDAASCDVNLYRKKGADAIAGVALIFHDSTAGESDRSDQTGDIELLTTSSVNVLAAAISDITDLTAIDNVDVIAYYLDEQGEVYLCSSQTNPYTI